MESLKKIAKLESLLDVYSLLLKQSGRHEAVDRVESLDPETFYERYYFGHRPVVLTGMLKDWEASRSWSPSYLAQHYGDVPVEVTVGRDSDPNYEHNFSKHRREMTLRDYVELVQSGGTTNDYYIVGKNLALGRGRLQELLDDLGSLDGILDPDFDPGWQIKFWFGPAGTVTPLHHDRTNILFAQIFGRKRFKLIPSYETHRVYNHKGAFSEVDMSAPDYERFPKLKEANVVEVVLEPGDVLFLPVGWWHWVRALDISISVTFQNFLVESQNTRWSAEGWTHSRKV